MFTTLPILLAGTMAVSLNVTSPLEPVAQKRPDKAKDSHSQLRKSVKEAMARQAAESAPEVAETAVTTAAVPSSYRVVAGDTVSGIAARYGLATASVLALNGLGWKSIIFPGQVLKLTKGSVAPKTPTAPPSGVQRYTIVSGDTISGIAARFGVPTQTVLSANGLGWSSIIYPGQSIVIPGPVAATTAPPKSDPAPSVDIVPVSEVTPIAPDPVLETRYVIRSGDTITSIAAKFGVSIQSILTANGLSLSSIIYAGRTLVIPGVGAAVASTGGSVAILTAEMERNARTILGVGRSLGVPEYGLVIALAAAMQESSLRNLNYGDRDSLGLFQQRPSTGWGTPAQVTDPVYASRLFFGGPSNPNKGKTRGLLDISGWQSMTVTQAAQAVQRSAYPNAYAKWETSARAWVAQLS
jgi:LysM repeat protein